MKIYNKILSVLFVPLSLTMVTSAEERSYEDIKNVALNFMTTQETQTDFTIDETNKTSISNATTQKNYQIINLKPKGWVLVSRDDIAKPILGYSKDGHLDTKSMPPAQKEWLLGLDNEIKAAKDENIDNSDFEADWNTLTDEPEAFKEDLINNVEPTATSSKGPLLGNIKWGQGSPYNNLTPKDHGRHTPVGCTATAMVQIMAYHKWPTRGVGSYSYTHKKYGKQSANFNTNYKWTRMSANDYAKISYHAGVSANMNYGPTGSAAWPSEANWRKFFKYDLENRSQKENSPINTWHTKIKSNIDRHLPIWYAGFQGSAGHAFVLDGYKYQNNNKLYHFNWGWNGYSNGWFTLSSMKAGSYHFNQNNVAIFGIKPKNGGANSSKPAAPSKLTAKVSSSTVALSWKDNANNETGFKIYVDNRYKGKTPRNRTRYTLRRLSKGTHTVKIVAYNKDGVSRPVSKKVTIRGTSPRPAAPSKLTARVSGSTAALSWKDNANNETGFIIYVDNRYKGRTSRNRTRYTLRRLSKGTHTIKVVAYNRAGASRPVSKRIRIR